MTPLKTKKKKIFESFYLNHFILREDNWELFLFLFARQVYYILKIKTLYISFNFKIIPFNIFSKNNRKRKLAREH